MNWFDIIQTAVTIILTSFMGYITVALNRRSVLKNSTADAVKILLRKEMREAYKSATNKGFVTLDDIEEMEEIYRIYHDELGGNGTGTRLYESFKTLPINKEG